MLRDVDDIKELWGLAFRLSAQSEIKISNISGNQGGGGEYSTEPDWAIDYRGVSTEEEHKKFNSTSEITKDSEWRRFGRRVPDDIFNRGIDILGRN